MSISVNRAVAAILFAQVAAGVAHAQTAPLEEVVVTAQKRAGNLQDTPIAISAVTGDAIEKLNIDDIGAIAAAAFRLRPHARSVGTMRLGRRS